MQSPKLRHCVDALDRELARARRHGHPLSVVAVEVPRPEDFPEDDAWNDRIGAALRTNARGADSFLPAGGSRWLAILPETSHDGALRMVERLTSRIASLAETLGAPLLVAFGIADRHCAPDGEGVLRTAQVRLVLAP